MLIGRINFLGFVPHVPRHYLDFFLNKHSLVFRPAFDYCFPMDYLVFIRRDIFIDMHLIQLSWYFLLMHFSVFLFFYLFLFLYALLFFCLFNLSFVICWLLFICLFFHFSFYIISILKIILQIRIWIFFCHRFYLNSIFWRDYGFCLVHWLIEATSRNSFNSTVCLNLVLPLF